MRLEKVYVNGEAYYREIPEEETEKTEVQSQAHEAPSFYKKTKANVSTAVARARAFGKRVCDGADALGKKISDGVRAVLHGARKGCEGEEISELMRLLPHMDAEGRHEVYLALSQSRERLDRARLGDLLPYLAPEDFEALCRIYREENS